MISHIGETASPVRNGEVSISPPSIPIASVATPRPLGNMIVEVDVDLVGGALGSDSVEDLIIYPTLTRSVVYPLSLSPSPTQDS